MRLGAIIAAALAVSLVGNLLLVIQVRRSEERARAAEDRAVAAEAKADSAAARRDPPRDALVFLDTSELRRLRALGLTDPVNQLRSDLGAHGSLIPFPGSLGGTMGFYDREGIVLLPGRFVFAPGEDGHNQVYAVLRYDVEPGGKIRWKLLDATKG
jgi:hypothetical protein